MEKSTEANDKKVDSHKRTVNCKRQRKKTKRLFQSELNLDEYFENTEEEPFEDSGESFQNSHSDSDSDNERPLQRKKSTAVIHSDKKTPCADKQMARIESKVDRLFDCVLQIQRMVISQKIGGTENQQKSHVIRELPLESVDSLNNFENALTNPAYKKDVSEFLLTINGFDGDKSGSKVLKSVVFALILPKLLCQYTWTGKSKKSNAKLNFASKKNTIQLIFEVLHAYDPKYLRAHCENDLKYRIFKYMYKESRSTPVEGNHVPHDTASDNNIQNSCQLTAPVASAEPADRMTGVEDQMHATSNFHMQYLVPSDHLASQDDGARVLQPSNDTHSDYYNRIQRPWSQYGQYFSL